MASFEKNEVYKVLKYLVSTILLILTAGTVAAAEINIYSYRQPFLIQPLTDAFTEETGIKVNVAYLRKGMIEKMTAEGKRSPADVVLTVDISRLAAVVDAGLTQPVVNQTLNKNIPSIYRDPENHWFPSSENDPVLYLRRGETYYFVVNASGHPFEIRTGSGGSAYSTGVTNNATQVGTVTFKVPMSAPSTLYYQCTAHSGMGNTINIV